MIKVDWKTASKLLQDKKVGIIPTDTIYGFSASIAFPESIARIYEIKSRESRNPLVILASSLDQIADTFPVLLSSAHHEIVSNSTTPTSVIYQIDPQRKDEWEHPYYKRDDFAIRIPNNSPELTTLLEQTGPIVSTSVNEQGQPPEENLPEIYKKFAEKIDFVVDIGELSGAASRIIRINKSGEQEILR